VKIWLSMVSWKQCKIGCKIVLVTNRKSHMGFQMVSKSVTLNDLNSIMAVIYQIR